MLCACICSIMYLRICISYIFNCETSHWEVQEIQEEEQTLATQLKIILKPPVDKMDDTIVS